eukprot:g88.t1
MCSYISTVALSQEPMPPAQPAEVLEPDASIIECPVTVDSPAQAADKVLPEQLEKLRQKAQEALSEGAASGELWNLLQRHAASKAQDEILEASRSGQLLTALQELRPDLEQIRRSVYEGLRSAPRVVHSTKLLVNG